MSDTPPVDLDHTPSAPVETAEIDYFGFSETRQVFLPGSQVQYVTIKALTEGEKVQYQDRSNRDVVVERGSGNARMKMAAGSERHNLLQSAITGWYVLRRPDAGGEPQPVQFTGAELKLFLRDANPKVVEHIEKEVRKMNPWLLADMEIEDIEREIASLEEMLEEKRREEAGNGGSASS